MEMRPYLYIQSLNEDKIQRSIQNLMDASAKLLQKTKYILDIYKKYTDCHEIQKTSPKCTKGDKSTTNSNKLTLSLRNTNLSNTRTTGSTRAQICIREKDVECSMSTRTTDTQ
uniref:Putative ovule protein n=1 Tax=Solanum chacoense TaxID=4108 RepID=A0A0V0GXI1_SOLCH